MKRFTAPLLAVAAFAVIIPSAHSQDQDNNQTDGDFPPRPFDARRYEAIWKRNPFLKEVIASDAPEQQTEDWAKGLVLRGVSRIQGRYVVHIEDTTPVSPKAKSTSEAPRSFRLVEGTADGGPDGLTIRAVKAHRDPTQVVVTVAKATGDATGEATVKYDPRAIAAKPVPRAPSPATTQRPTTTGRATNAPATPAAQANQPNRNGRGREAGGRRGGGTGNVRGEGGGPTTQGADGRRQRFGNGGRGNRGGGRSSQNGTTNQRRVILPPGTGR